MQPDAQIMLFSVVVGVRVHHKFGGLQLEEPGARADLHVVIVTWMEKSYKPETPSAGPRSPTSVEFETKNTGLKAT
ncbi:hypothetical protein A5N17_13765 [Arthrobacter sp. D2]|nr:hypothetical protein [Arthrobacter sp. M5]OEH61568.1 hypothetical protein A5N17_13765 [Arthrobacter sp. D2]OEH61627.1 hypothetical protein A5N13_16185 [Arthrobacter sp. D4]